MDDHQFLIKRCLKTKNKRGINQLRSKLLKKCILLNEALRRALHKFNKNIYQMKNKKKKTQILLMRRNTNNEVSEIKSYHHQRTVIVNGMKISSVSLHLETITSKCLLKSVLKRRRVLTRFLIVITEG